MVAEANIRLTVTQEFEGEFSDQVSVNWLGVVNFVSAGGRGECQGRQDDCKFVHIYAKRNDFRLISNSFESNTTTVGWKGRQAMNHYAGIVS